MAHNPLWKFFGFFPMLALGLTGCAGLNQDISQEIKQDKIEVRQQLEQRENAYEKREYLGLTSKDSENWNSTDWSMWMNAHGGR
jgi:hypothetical protein